MLKRLSILALFGVMLVSANVLHRTTKTYTISVTDPTQVGVFQLSPGEYRVKVDGSQPVLLDKAGHPIDTPARLEAVDSKYSQTSALFSNADGIRHLESIQLGGTKTKVVFEK